MKKITKLEKNILFTRIKASIMWMILLLVYVYFFTVHWVFGLFWSFSFPVFAYMFYQENLYYPYHSYFRKCFLKKSKEERQHLSNQVELLGKYLHLGEVVFLEQQIVFTKFGVVLSYDNVKNIFYKKTQIGRDFSNPRFYYLVTIETEDSKKYRFKAYDLDKTFVGGDSMFSKIKIWIFSQKNRCIDQKK